MRRKHFFLGLAAVMALCSCNSRQEPLLTATLEGIQADSVYLYKVDNEYYDAVSLYASIKVVDGKFTFALDTVPASVYCLSLQDMRKGGALEQSKYLFLEPVKMQLAVSKDKEGHLALHVTGSYLQEKYEAFQKDKYIAGEQAVIDSLDRLFYAARDRSDTLEMERIREISIPYYEKGRELVSELIRNEVEKNKENLFGLYLYYTYFFQNHTFGTKEEIEEIRERLDDCNAEARKSVYYERITKDLAHFERCATGSVAPAISGMGLNGETVNLSDFKGKYVLVDFWFAACQWCRLENPYLQKTYADFKDQGFTILGVSTDHREADWRKAIEEDKSNWNHLLLQGDGVRTTQDVYCIVGFPHIILVNPEGVIVAKELRGDQLYNTVKKFVTGEETDDDNHDDKES